MEVRRVWAWVRLSGILLSALAVTGCNTVEGIGRDVESLGDAIEDAADDADD
jgi:predicted small secreted protein